MSNNNSSSIWPIVLIIFGLAVLVQMISGNTSDSVSTVSSTPTPAGSGNVEYRYAKERFKQEGFSNSDADTAARAVIKFNEAQKARGQ